MKALSKHITGDRYRSLRAASRRVLALSLIVTSAALALAIAEPASAHNLDTYHQHGWNSALLFDPVMQCVGAPYYGASGSVSVAVPDFMTTPGGTRRVYFRAWVERYDFSAGTWVMATWDGARWVPLGLSPWYYTLANMSGPVFGWRELGTDRYGPVRVGFNVQPGYFYRFMIQYHWGADGTQHEQATGYCKV